MFNEKLAESAHDAETQSESASCAFTAKLEELLRDLKPRFEDGLRKNPSLALLTAGAIGLVAGMFLRRK